MVDPVSDHARHVFGPVDGCDECDASAGQDVELVHELLARGVPWPMAIEAVASTRLDRDERVQTHSVRDASRPRWWRDDDDGVRITDRD